jgi:hypothetical protein
VDRMHADDDARRAVQAAGSLWSGAGSDDGVDADARDGRHVTRQAHARLGVASDAFLIS